MKNKEKIKKNYLYSNGLWNWFFSDLRQNSNLANMIDESNIENFRNDLIKECRKKFLTEKEIDDYLQSQNMMLNELEAKGISLKKVKSFLDLIVAVLGGISIIGIFANYFIERAKEYLATLPDFLQPTMVLGWAICVLAFGFVILYGSKWFDFRIQRIRNIIEIIQTDKELILQRNPETIDKNIDDLR